MLKREWNFARARVTHHVSPADLTAASVSSTNHLKGIIMEEPVITDLNNLTISFSNAQVSPARVRQVTQLLLDQLSKSRK